MLAFYQTLIEDQTLKIEFEHIYHNYKNQMFYVANSVLKNTHDSEDVVQETLASIAKNMKSIANLSDEVHLKNYVLKATKNRALNLLPKRKKAKELIDIDTRYDISDDSFLDKICDNHEYDEILDAINSLKSTYKDSLYYHFVLGYSAKEVAIALDEKVATIKQRLVRGKKKLIELLVEKGFDANGE
ncbi:MAG: sigma-70 family RNA polymerase sigma factor [Clostridia bacterium]